MKLGNKTKIVIAIGAVLVFLIGGSVLGSLATSNSEDAPEGVNDQILTFDVGCPEGYEFDVSGSTCIPIQKDENETGLTEAEQFALAIKLVKAFPAVCIAENKSDIMLEACLLNEMFKDVD